MGRKKIQEINERIAEVEVQLADLAKKSVSKHYTTKTKAMMASQVRKLETELDRKMVQLNERICSNKKLRANLDHFRMERLTMDAVYTSLEMEKFQLQHKIKKMVRYPLADYSRLIQ